MKLIIFIHTCTQYENTRAKLLEETWAGVADVVFITDNKTSKLKNHIYVGPYIRGPTYHPETVKKMFHLFVTNYSDYDFFMIIDDDSYLYIDKLKMYLSYFDKDQPYMIGDFLNWTHYNGNYNYGGNYEHWAGGGPGFVFTKSCINEFIAIYSTHTIAYENHDVWLHKLFKLSNGKIKRTHCPGFHQHEGNILFNKYSKSSNNMVSVHLNHDMTLLTKYHI